MTNEFYLSKYGRAFHGDLGDNPKFVAIGLEAAFNTLQKIKHWHIEGAHKAIHYLAYGHLLYLKKKEKFENEVWPSMKQEVKQKVDYLYNNKLTELSVGCLSASLLISSGVIYAQIKSIPKPRLQMSQLHQAIPNEYDLRIPLEEVPFIDKNLLVQHYFYPSYQTDLVVSSFTASSQKKQGHSQKPVSVFKNKKEAFTKLLFVAEGKSKVFYKDNIGVATAYGWNPTTNPKEFNLPIAKAMGFNSREQKAIADISSNSSRRPISYVPASLKKIVLSEKQLKQSAAIMMVEYEKEFMNVLKVKARQKNQDFDKIVKGYEALPSHQQAVLLHMTYKVGAHNLLKYNEFFDHLFRYFNSPTKRNMQLVSNNFEYNYKTRDGQKVRDTRVEKKHGIFFSNCTVEKKPVKTEIKKEVQHNKFTSLSDQSCQDLVVKAEEKIETKVKKAKNNFS